MNGADDFYGCGTFGDRALGAIIIGDNEAFFQYAGSFWENRYNAQKYIEKALVCGSNDLALKMVRICEEKAMFPNHFIYILTHALESALREQCPELIRTFMDIIKEKTPAKDCGLFINKSLIRSVSMYGRDVPETDDIGILIEAGADINCSIWKNPFSLVGAAVQAGKYKFALDMIERPDFDILKHQPPGGKYSLMNMIIGSSCSTEAKARLLKKLISLGADVNTRGTGIGYQSFSPIGLAVFMDNPLVFHILEKAHADLYGRDISGNSAFDYMQQLKADSDDSQILRFLGSMEREKDSYELHDSEKPLFAAIRKNNVSLVGKILDRGISPNARTRYGMPALSVALANRADPKIAKLLLDAGADPNICDSRGIPSFFIPALWLKRSDTPEDIRYNGITVPGTNRNECGTKETYAMLDKTLKEIEQVTSMMLNAGADPNMKANDKQKKYGYFHSKSQPTPVWEDDLFYGLHMNILKEYMRVYWREGCSTDSVFNYDVLYPCLESFRRSVDRIFTVSFKCGLDPNYSSGTGETLVDIAAAANMNSVLAMLIEAGADLDRYEPFETNPFLYAIPEGAPTSGYTRTFIDFKHKMRYIDPAMPVGMQYSERGMSDLEMRDKISGIKGTAEIFLKAGFVPDIELIRNVVKKEPFYLRFPEIGEFLLDADGYSMRVRSLDREDNKESEGVTGYEFDI